MAGPKKSATVAVPRSVAAGPYTDPGDGNRSGRGQRAMSEAVATAIHALDRKTTDGLNLVHEQLQVARQERREIRRELGEFRTEIRQELKTEIATVTGRLDRMEDAIRELTALVSTLLERSRGTRRLVWGVLGTIGLLAAGGVLRPVFDRVVAALVGG